MIRAVARARFQDALTASELADVQLLVIELVTNAIAHGEGDVRLRLDVDESAIRGEVVDEGRGFERELRERGVEDLDGRGLSIVGALAERWGVHDGSSHVWFEMTRAPTPPTADEPELGVARRPPELA